GRGGAHEKGGEGGEHLVRGAPTQKAQAAGAQPLKRQTSEGQGEDEALRRTRTMQGRKRDTGCKERALGVSLKNRSSQKGGRGQQTGIQGASGHSAPRAGA
ncbi:hypothetical protein RF55_26356, partial [Lasius niger]